MTVKRSFHFDAPVGTVFEFFKDPSKSADIDQPMHMEDLKVTKDGVGTHFAWRMKLGRYTLPFEGFELYTDVVPNERITELSFGPMAGRWETTFEREGTGTRVTIEVTPRSFWRIPPMTRLMDLVTARQSARLFPLYEAAIKAEAKKGKPRTVPSQPRKRAAAH